MGGGERGRGDDGGFFAGGGDDAVDECGERGGGVTGDGDELHVFGGVAIVKGEDFGKELGRGGLFHELSVARLKKICYNMPVVIFTMNFY